MPIPSCLDDCSFVVEPEVRQLIPSVPFFFLKIALAIQRFFYFHTNCEIICSSSVKNTIGSFIGRIPGTGEPGGLPSMGSHRVGHDWSNLAAAAA